MLAEDLPLHLPSPPANVQPLLVAVFELGDPDSCQRCPRGSLIDRGILPFQGRAPVSLALRRLDREQAPTGVDTWHQDWHYQVERKKDRRPRIHCRIERPSRVVSVGRAGATNVHSKSTLLEPGGTDGANVAKCVVAEGIVRITGRRRGGRKRCPRLRPVGTISIRFSGGQCHSRPRNPPSWLSIRLQ